MANVFPLPPETVRCTKCLRDVVIASTLQGTMQSECLIADCPIRNDPNNQPSELAGTLISFTEPSEITQAGRISRFEQWEKVGVQAIREDLHQGGTRYVGGPPAVQDLAREWVREKEAQTPAAPSSAHSFAPATRGEDRRMPVWDVFISHASEDKDDFVRPLAQGLDNRGLNVWFDEYTLTVGDSLRRSIDRGLAGCRFGIVVISPNFLHKEWPQRELDGLVTREIGGKKVILPVWHNISAEQIR
jgi:hypothetical protein